ncbi:VTT domain-containing protein [Danxiaibacter flavus]|uniref:VTT domain-containing protein n=1 Tax=Danxiaibacter flavus TaxID=3049108 RepID=A0ABV3ZPX0_9BACT|nr:VTT domain-containing protein [Chitinophagaceae bacterium DXS]
MEHSDLSAYIYSFSYLGIFFWFALLEQLTPIPEEVSLISLGYICTHSSLNPLLAGAVSVVALLTTDNVFFYLSLKGSKVVKKTIGKVSSGVLKRLRTNLKKNAKSTLFVLALLPKLRFLSPVVSATVGISWKLFFIVNSIATGLYVAFYIVVGMLFQKQLAKSLQKLHLTQHITFVASMACITVIVFIVIKKWVANKKDG